MKSFLILLACLLFQAALQSAQRPINVLAETNGTLRFPPNFFTANSNLLNAAVLPTGYDSNVSAITSSGGILTADFTGAYRQTNSENGSLAIAFTNKPSASIQKIIVLQFGPAGGTLNLTWPSTVSGSPAEWIGAALTSIASGTFKQVIVLWNGQTVYYIDLTAPIAISDVTGLQATLDGKQNAALSATDTLDFGSIAAGASADLTITVTGAVAGDSVYLGLPAAPDTTTVFNGFVSAPDIVTVRCFNIGAAPVDPASGLYRATVQHF